MWHMLHPGLKPAVHMVFIRPVTHEETADRLSFSIWIQLPEMTGRDDGQNFFILIERVKVTFEEESGVYMSEVLS